MTERFGIFRGTPHEAELKQLVEDDKKVRQAAKTTPAEPSTGDTVDRKVPPLAKP